jgi:serine phosphatase RsbU (regulator of sigma subunit)
VETADGLIHLLVGDVSGRGPDAAALGAALRIAWRALTLAGLPGENVLRSLHRLAEHERQDPEVFATLCMLEIDPIGRTLGLRRAGHPPPVLVGADGIITLPLAGGGPPIGMFAQPDWPESRVALPADWSLLLYTDGLIEATVGRSTNRLGEDGLRRLMIDYVEREQNWRSDPHGLLRQLLATAEELNGAELSDDVAMLFVGARAGGAAPDGLG